MIWAYITAMKEFIQCLLHYMYQFIFITSFSQLLLWLFKMIYFYYNKWWLHGLMPILIIRLGRFFLLFHSTILKPNFNLSFRKTKIDSHFCSLGPTQVSEKCRNKLNVPNECELPNAQWAKTRKKVQFQMSV